MRNQEFFTTETRSLAIQPMKRANLMIVKRIAFALIVTVIASVTVGAQSGGKRDGWTAWAGRKDHTELIQLDVNRNRPSGLPGSDNLDVQASDRKDPIGSWILDVTPTGGEPFKALVTFTQDGGLLESETGAFGSTAHGAWVKAGGRKFTLTFVVLLSSDLAGTFAGTAKIRSTVVIDGDEYIDPGFTVDVFDPDGNLVFTGGGTAHGRRIVAEP